MPNFTYYATTFLKIKENELKHGTYIHYEGIVKRSILPYFKDKNIQEIKASELRLWLLNFNRSNKTLSHYISVLNGIFKEAFYDEILTNNPCKYIKKPKKIRLDIKPFTKQEIDSILAHADNYNFRMYLYIAFYTGLRSGEIIGLQKQDIDFEKNILHVRRSRNRNGETTPKTDSGFRTVPLLDDLKPHLQSIYQKYEGEYLFYTQHMKPYNDNNTFLNKQWRPLLNELKIPYRRLYNTRHTFATMMLTHGFTTPHNLARILGHRDSQMVHEVYARFLNDGKFDFDLDIKLY